MRPPRRARRQGERPATDAGRLVLGKGRSRVQWEVQWEVRWAWARAEAGVLAVVLRPGR